MGLFNKKPKITIENLNSRLEKIESMMHSLSESYDAVIAAYYKIRETSDMTPDEIALCKRIREYAQVNTDLSDIHKIIKVYGEISLNIVPSGKKQRIVCGKCGAMLSEGEFYIKGQDYFCLKHLQEDKIAEPKQLAKKGIRGDLVENGKDFL